MSVEHLRQAVEAGDADLHTAPVEAVQEALGALDFTEVIEQLGELVTKLSAWRSRAEEAVNLCNEVDVNTGMASLEHEALLGTKSPDADMLISRTVAAGRSNRKVIVDLGVMDNDVATATGMLASIAQLLKPAAVRQALAARHAGMALAERDEALAASARYKVALDGGD